MKKVTINRVDLGSRVVGYEVLNPGVNGSEILGLAPQAMKEAVRSGEVVGVVLNESGELVPDETRGFKSIMVKTGAGTLNSTDPNAVANILYVAWGRDGDNFKLVSSRFGHFTYCAEKVRALLDLGAVSGVVECDGQLRGWWELEEAEGQPQAEPKEAAPAQEEAPTPEAEAPAKVVKGGAKKK